MDNDKREVKASDSPADNKNGHPSHRGKDGVDRTYDDVVLENQRKGETILKQTGELASLKNTLEEMQEELDELKSIKNPTNRQQGAIDSLENSIDSLAEQVKQTENGKVWLHLTKKEMEQETNRKLLEDSTQRADWYLEDKAEELGMRNANELAKEIAPYAAQYMRLLPERRNQLAFRDWQKSKSQQESIKKREEEIKKKEEEMKSYAEGRGRVSRDPSIQEKFNKGNVEDRVRIAAELVEQASRQ
jgi:hypothetical protein